MEVRYVMSKTRWALAGLVCVYLLSLAFASAVASAASPEWWVEGEPIKATEKFEKEPKVFVHPNIKTANIDIECSFANFEGGSINSGEEGRLPTLIFEACKVASPSNCEVANIETEPLFLPLEEVAKVVKLRFKPQSGGRLIALFDIKSVPGKTCAVAGEKELIGAKEGGGLTANFLNAEREWTEHKLEFSKTSGSAFDINSEPGELTMTLGLKMVTGHKYSVQ